MGILSGYARVCVLSEIKTQSGGGVIKYGDILHFSDGVSAKKSRLFAKESPSAIVKGDFMMVGFEVPVSVTGKLMPTSGGLLLHSLAKLGSRNRAPWCSFIKASYSTKKIPCEAGDAPLFNVPIQGGLGKHSVVAFSIDGFKHREELLGKGFAASVEMQLARAAMQTSARKLNFPISTDTFFGARENSDVATTLMHSMHGSISNRILDDYAHIGPLSKKAENDAMDKYIESANVAVASVANLKLVSSKVLKALAHKFRGEFTPHFKSMAISSSQAAAGVGGTMADSHVPPLAVAPGRARGATPPQQPRIQHPRILQQPRESPATPEAPQQGGPAAKRVRGVRDVRDDHIRSGDSVSTSTARGDAALASPAKPSLTSSPSKPSPAAVALKVSNDDRVQGAERKAIEEAATALATANTKVLDEWKERHNLLKTAYDQMAMKLIAAEKSASKYQAESDTKDFIVRMLKVNLTLTHITLTLILSPNAKPGPDPHCCRSQP